MQVLRGLAQQNKRIKVIDFSRNFGKVVALTAGVQAARTDAVITMDADLQHPPELIPQWVSKWEKGAEVVATIRNSTERQPVLRWIGSHLYYWLMARISGLDIASQTTQSSTPMGQFHTPGNTILAAQSLESHWWSARWNFSFRNGLGFFVTAFRKSDKDSAFACFLGAIPGAPKSENIQ